MNPDVPSTLEAAALCTMADRGQITGASTDRWRWTMRSARGGGNQEHLRLSPDGRPSSWCRILKPVTCWPSLSFLADADAAGIVLGAKVPIILTSRADEEMARLASCAVAQLLVAARKADANSSIQ